MAGAGSPEAPAANQGVKLPPAIAAALSHRAPWLADHIVGRTSHSFLQFWCFWAVVMDTRNWKHVWLIMKTIFPLRQSGNFRRELKLANAPCHFGAMEERWGRLKVMAFATFSWRQASGSAVRVWSCEETASMLSGVTYSPGENPPPPQ